MPMSIIHLYKEILLLSVLINLQSSFTFVINSRLSSFPTIRHDKSNNNKNKHKTTSRSCKFRIFVRNIDLPECLVFYGSNTLSNADGSGLESLLQECKDVGTAVAVIVDKHSNSKISDSLTDFSILLDRFQKYITLEFSEQVPPPHPHDLLVILDKLMIQPRPFGGSAGFASKLLPDPPRSPLSSRTVVIATTLDQTRAARAAGMRVIVISNGNNESCKDNHLADAVLDSIDFWLDDIATPGSFWLNPPNPRDDESNKVDPEEMMASLLLLSSLESTTTTTTSSAYIQSSTTAIQQNTSSIDIIGSTLASKEVLKSQSIGTNTNVGSSSDMDEAELLRILADIDPL